MLITRPSRSPINPESLRLPLIALIDVVLFLLFYFVISFSISAEERELAATLAAPGGSTSPLAAQVVRIEWSDGRPKFHIGMRSFNDRDSLAEMLRQLPKEAGIVVTALPEMPIEAVAAAAQAARDAGFSNINYAPADAGGRGP